MSSHLLTLTILLLATVPMTFALALPSSKPVFDVTLLKPADLDIIARDASATAPSTALTSTTSSTSTALTDPLARLLRRDACSSCNACYGTTCGGSTTDCPECDTDVDCENCYTV